MGLGTFGVLIVSDPMVDVLTAIGDALNISSFYVAFVLAPFASNASELIAAYNYASKKTKDTMTTSLNSLLGAGSMNNTCCLGVFLALIYFKKLYWTYSAETISILVIEIIVAVFAIKSQRQTMLDAMLVLLLFPLSLVFVYFLENVAHLD